MGRIVKGQIVRGRNVIGTKCEGRNVMYRSERSPILSVTMIEN
jgi:hypothetical protein